MKNPSNLRTILGSVLVVLVAVLAAQGGRLLHLRVNAPSKAQNVRDRKHIPYTVTMREIIHAPDGTIKVSRNVVEAIRNDGSMLKMTSTDKGARRSLNFSSGLQVDTHDLDGTKTSRENLNSNSKRWQRDPGSQCMNALDGEPFDSDQIMVGEETIAGFRTVKITTGIITSWHALDYGCAKVKDVWQFGPNEFTEKELVALNGGEPEANLFQVPANYREVSPSERVLGPNKDRRPCNEAGVKALRKLDDDYQRAKRATGKERK